MRWCFAGLLITWGVVGDRIGRKRVLLFGMLCFGTTSALCSFAHNPTELIIYRSLMGIGAAAIQPQTLSIIQNVFEPEERGKAIGIWAGSSGMAIALGPIVGGALIKYFWWGSVFLVNVPFVIVGAVAIFFLVPESKDPRPQKVDPSGVLLSIVALVLLVYGIIEGGNSNDWLTVQALGAIVAGIVLLTVFVVKEKRSTHPTIDVNLFRNKQFAAGGAAIALTFFALMGSTFYLAYFLQGVRGYTPLACRRGADPGRGRGHGLRPGRGPTVGPLRNPLRSRRRVDAGRSVHGLLCAGRATHRPMGHRGPHVRPGCRDGPDHGPRPPTRS